jgi:hypothetical protein
MGLKLLAGLTTICYLLLVVNSKKTSTNYSTGELFKIVNSNVLRC